MVVIQNVIEFEWDEGNRGKNRKHRVDDKESEEVFFDEHSRIFKDVLHSQHEERLRIIGKTQQGRLLFIVFTKRGDKVRIISARDTNRNEEKLYEEAT